MSPRVLIRSKPDRRNLILYYVDPESGREVTRSAGTHVMREAEREAARWETELAQKSISGEMSWEHFRVKFEDDHVSSLAPKTAAAYRTAMNHWERVIGKPKHLKLINAELLNRFAATLRKEEMPPTSVSTYLRHISSSLGWAQKVGLVQVAPRCIMPRTGKRRLARSRPITNEEFEKMLKAIDEVDFDDKDGLRFLCRGLWLSGLRIGEAARLSWNRPPLRVNLDTDRPVIVVWHDGQKSKQDELVPITPDFAELLKTVPKGDRNGLVFKVFGVVRSVVDAISEVGRKAKVVVNDTDKHATAHDFRRSFGTRWATKVHPVVLQRLMRHANIATTMSYYVDIDAREIVDQVWQAYYGTK